MMEEMKTRYKVSGKTVQVADKGLNCARNIYAAVKEADDGYIFSKAIRGTGLSAKEKQWILLETMQTYGKSHGQRRYALVSAQILHRYLYVPVQRNGSGNGKEIIKRFSVVEKRIVSYNPALAKKQRAEIMKMVDKASNFTTYKKLTQEELGDSAKYIKITTKDKNGRKIKPLAEVDQTKIDEDLKYAGYNLMVTSELDMEPLQVYQTYHNLWKIEESFRITKSYLDARPVYVQKKETIYGHF